MVYKYVDIVGVSSEGITEAVRDGAAKSIKSLRWAEVGKVTLRIEDQKIQEYHRSENRI
jgi:flavin-binding protein dodecin